jgi:hypothetical protein
MLSTASHGLENEAVISMVYKKCQLVICNYCTYKWLSVPEDARGIKFLQTKNRSLYKLCS